MSRTRLLRARVHPIIRALRRPTPRRRASQPTVLRRAGTIAAHLLTIALIVSVPAAAFADSGTSVYLAANTLPVVIAKLQLWIMGILFAIATLFLVLAGVYRVTAGGNSAQVDKSNEAFKNAVYGYGLAVLAPILLEILKGILGAP
jgi:hypothetical protein